MGINQGMLKEVLKIRLVSTPDEINHLFKAPFALENSNLDCRLQRGGSYVTLECI